MSEGTTLFDRLKDEYALDTNVLVARKRGQKPTKVTDGLRPKRPALVEGLQVLSPEELLTLRVSELSVNSAVRGYQRPFDSAHARKAAQALRNGDPFPPVLVALNGRGQLEVVEGQHRAAAGVMARVPIEAVIKRMDAATRRALFTGQRFSKRVDPNVLILTDTGPFQRYVQEAATDPAHPWGNIVSAKSKTRITPYVMFQLLVRYVGQLEGQGTGIRHLGGFDERWDRDAADGLAPRIACFGNRKSHPLAFRPWTVKAIGQAATWVFRRNEPHTGDGERWLVHMPAFPFEHYLFIRTQAEMTDVLLAHWNKRLSSRRRIVRTGQAA